MGKLALNIDQRLFYREAVLHYAPVELIGLQSQDSFPSSYGPTFPHVLNKSRWVFLISPLLSVCCPVTVFRRITERAILSLYGMLWRWPRSHIIIKMCKAILPSITYSDSSGPVPSVGFHSGVMTPTTHIIPHPIFWSSTQAVSPVAICGHIGLKASAGPRIVTAQIPACDKDGVAARALAPPRGSPLWHSFRDILYRSQATKSLASQVFWFSHAGMGNRSENHNQGVSVRS